MQNITQEELTRTKPTYYADNKHRVVLTNKADARRRIEDIEQAKRDRLENSFDLL